MYNGRRVSRADLSLPNYYMKTRKTGLSRQLSASDPRDGYAITFLFLNCEIISNTISTINNWNNNV